MPVDDSLLAFVRLTNQFGMSDELKSFNGKTFVSGVSPFQSSSLRPSLNSVSAHSVLKSRLFPYIRNDPIQGREILYF